MELFPAIDLLGGKAVRLFQGDYAKAEVFSDNPAATAGGFRDAGADNLHVVDLDGARDGQTVNFAVVSDIVRQSGLFVQVGGGIRDEQRIERYLALGVGRVILGTAALESVAFLTEMVRKYGEKIAVAVDARDEKVAVRGWLEQSGTDAPDFCRRLDDIGVSTIIYTDISRDGAMAGCNLDIYGRLAGSLRCDIIASGGISSVAELTALKSAGARGAILGKAIYTGAINLKEAISLCR